MTELVNKDIIDLQDIEKIQFLQTLQADPVKYAAYVSDKKSRIISETVDTKRASFMKVSDDMARTMDMDHNSLASLYRTNDLSLTQDHIIDEQKSQFKSRKYNEDLTRRQVEINNWYYEDKRETLFLLQIALLVMLSLVIVMGVSSFGWITRDATNFLLVFIMSIGSLTWIYRWYYTRWVRDPAFWSKRKFADDANKPAPMSVCIGAEVVVPIHAIPYSGSATLSGSYIRSPIPVIATAEKNGITYYIAQDIANSVSYIKMVGTDASQRYYVGSISDFSTEKISTYTLLTTPGLYVLNL